MKLIYVHHVLLTKLAPFRTDSKIPAVKAAQFKLPATRDMPTFLQLQVLSL